MQLKLQWGAIGLIAGVLLTWGVITVLSKPPASNTSMDHMTASLRNKKGDTYDEAFIASMIDHHQAAVDMAKLSGKQAKHSEIKQLSEDIIKAQEKEIAQMKQWQMSWGYVQSSPEHEKH